MREWSANAVVELDLRIKILHQKLDLCDQENLWGPKVQECRIESEKCYEKRVLM